MNASYGLVAVLCAVLAVSLVDASLDVSLEVGEPQINQMEDQTITVTANQKGKGMLFVVQPAEGTPWIDFLEDHPVLKALWDSLPSDIKTKIASAIGDKIVSYATVCVDIGGGSQDLIFPGNFTGINGEPSTSLVGTYKVILAFISIESPRRGPNNSTECCCIEADFDCKSWTIVPEFSLPTIAALLSALMAVSTLRFIKKIRRK